MFALYESSADADRRITLHHTQREAYARLMDDLGAVADDSAPDADLAELNDIVDWCQENADAQGAEFFVAPVSLP